MNGSVYATTLNFLGLPIREIDSKRRREQVIQLKEYTDSGDKTISEIISESIDVKTSIVQEPILNKGCESLGFSEIVWSDKGMGHKMTPTVYLKGGCVYVAVDDNITGDIGDISEFSLKKWNEFIYDSYFYRQKISSLIISSVNDFFGESDSSNKKRCRPYTCDINALELLDENIPINYGSVIHELKKMTGLNEVPNNSRYSEMIFHLNNLEIPVACLNTEIDENRRIINILAVPDTNEVVVKRLKEDYLNMVN
ncbi:MAG: hypothetical protein GQ477_02385 [Nanohaloarchaea archaeon]|nr:hypothetical protein [Candidatus Nanohaloarchaea archaeon]